MPGLAPDYIEMTSPVPCRPRHVWVGPAGAGPKCLRAPITRRRRVYQTLACRAIPSRGRCQGGSALAGARNSARRSSRQVEASARGSTDPTRTVGAAHRSWCLQILSPLSQSKGRIVPQHRVLSLNEVIDAHGCNRPRPPLRVSTRPMHDDCRDQQGRSQDRQHCDRDKTDQRSPPLSRERVFVASVAVAINQERPQY